MKQIEETFELLQTRLITIDEFEAWEALPANRERSFELVHGEIVEKAMPTELHGVIVANLIAALWLAIRQLGGGRVGAEIRNRMPGDEHNARQPDVSYYADTTRPIVTRGPVRGMPDIAAEVKSPNDSYKTMREKADYYLANGSRIVWLIFPEERSVEVHQAGMLEILGVNDTVDGGDVLPGLALPVRDLFPA
ncbi:MAG TPA: Uma2 family endonuclease [Candidatus Limnocylindrales bacterium]|nr:Uma2 family endonuclease [Candidatus Limnocylindrales bacterium]